MYDKAISNEKKKRHKIHPIWKEKVKLSVHRDMILYIEKTKGCMQNSY